MEIRKIVVVESGGQKKTVIETGAETLAELKQALDNAHIDYTDKTFFEGLSKTELTHDDSLLPRDIPRNGATTNNLVFMLTSPQKKIKSGAMTRLEAYAYIKENGLKEACLVKYGKNFTLCKTDDLLGLIEESNKKKEPKAEEPKAEEPKVEDTMTEKVNKVSVENAFRVNDIILIDSEEADEVISWLDEVSDNDNEVPSNCPYTEKELEDIVNSCTM